MAIPEASLLDSHYSMSAWYYYMGLRETLDLLINNSVGHVFTFNDMDHILVYNIYDSTGYALIVVPIYG